MARTDYAANCGSQNINEVDAGPASLAQGDSGTFNWNMTDGGLNPTFTGLVYRRSQVTFLDIARGTTSVVMFGEKHVNTTKYLTGNDPGDNEGMYVGCDNDTLRCTWDPPLRDTNSDNATRFGSAHTGGCNISFADGSVRLVSYDIDTKTFYLRGDRTGSKTAANR
jgi:prepilin-type processing-associated H-X9-DG protein